MRLTTCLGLILAGLAVPAASAQDGSVPDLRPYLRHAESAAAITQALGQIDDCMAPLDFEPGGEGDIWTLSLVCADGVTETGRVTIEFQVHPVSGDWPLLEPLRTWAEPAGADE